MLVPARLENGWFYLGEDRAVLPEFTVEHAPAEEIPAGYAACSAVTDDFRGDSLHLMWNYIYNPVEGLIQQTASGLQMHGNEVSSGKMLPRRGWDGGRNTCCTVEADLHFVPQQEGEEASDCVHESGTSL
ncbi:MAG: hypothetical protein ACLT3Y_06525 [Ruminococcus callidus]